MAVYVTRRAQFSASHRLYNPEFTDQQNWEVYGHCNNPHGHGHNYQLEVTLRGDPDPQTGMIVDLKWLKEVVHEKIITLMDHKHLNFDVPFMQGVIPTVENLVKAIWDVLEAELPDGMLFAVKLHETENNWAVYFGNCEERLSPEQSREAATELALTSGLL